MHDAELACERRLDDDRDDIDSLMLLAEIHLATGRPDTGLALLQRLVGLKPRECVPASTSRRAAINEESKLGCRGHAAKRRRNRAVECARAQ